jgi:hypothetical protein
MKKLILSLTMVAFAVALQAGENCAKACATKATAATCDKAKATAATCDKAKATAATCDKAKATAATCDKATAKATTCCASKQARKADATAKGATLLAKR